MHCSRLGDCHVILLSVQIMGDCRNSSSVQMFKLPNIWMSQTSAKSLPNLEICVFFVQIWKKVVMSGQAVFCPNFISSNLPN